ncbi:hypothetical protein LO762_25170 [Actinocorallia sp. API 0066]|uniref:hypothetical protein n=1 Tax=Actinocorallia sp. API 0066 TaxID=2896846 RepID=UPI001E4A03E2|nr:hypothetical protein [Actinocorallia sp. API 0066]MCD0452453.1 hypothetical protein [Actinocorallia sp. API 0066]
MGRWRQWLGRCAVVCVAGFALMLVLGRLAEPDDAPAAVKVLSLVVGWVWALSVLALPVLAYLGYREGKQEQRHNEGQLTVAHQHGLSEGRKLTATLLAGGQPVPLTVWGLVLEPGEVAHLDLKANYARYYSQNTTYQHVVGLFVGHPGFVAAGVALTEFGNSARRRQAEFEAMERWRDQQFTRVIATDRRLICQVFGKWLSFYYSAATAFYPEPAGASLVFEFSDTSPMVLFGPEVPLLVAYTTARVHGPESLRTHPALAPLR